MSETIASLGFASRCQAPKRPFPTAERKTTYEVMQDAIAMEKATKLADRIAELKNKPAEELTGSEKIELAYYNVLKSIAKFNSMFNTVIY